MIIIIVRVLLVLLAIVGIVGAGFYAFSVRAPGPPGDSATRSAIVDWLEAVTESGASPAISVAVIRDGDLIWEHAAGTADVFADRAATPDTVYHVWSVTKVATALAVLDLVEDERLGLDDEVAEYVPWLNLEATDGREMTVRDLLRHTSGLADTVPAVFGWLRYDEALPNQTDYLRKRMPEYRKPIFSPGEDRKYSNLGYMVLGAVIEAVTGEDYADVIRERVLVPAGMESSDFIFRPDLAPDEALGTHPVAHIFTPLLPFLIDMGDFVRERRGRLWWLNRLYVEATPPTGLVTTARDAAKLAHAAMTEGVVLGGDSLALMLAEADDDPPLGWFGRGGEDARWLQHRGGGPGYAAVARVYPDEGLAIAVIGNGTSAPVTDVADVIAQLELGDRR